jgi:hypothetical protein
LLELATNLRQNSRRARDRTGYEISFTRHFYKPQPLRTLEEIRADILALNKETEGLLGEILGTARPAAATKARDWRAREP